jgi:hypothetical protein
MALHLTKVAFGATSVDQLADRLALRAKDGPAEGGRVAIHIDPALVIVQSRPKRAHQGWRYLEAGDAPDDLGGDATGLSGLPPALVGKLAELALI